MVFREGQTLIEDGDVGDAAVLIVSGEAICIKGPLIDEAQPVAPGSLIGELSMLVDQQHTSTVIARTTIKALRITREDLQDQMYDDPSLAEHMANKVATRLNSLVDQLKSIEKLLAEPEDEHPPQLRDMSVAMSPQTNPKTELRH